MRVVIVGGGPCGLYIAHLLFSLSIPSLHITLIESEDRVGGRTQMGNYKGQVVVAGAGIIRKTDKRLRKLCRQLDIPTHPFQTNVNYPRPYQSKQYFFSLLETFKKRSSEFNLQETFSQNFQRILGNEKYQDFIEMAGYTDFEDANVWDSLRDYGWKDNTSGQTMYSVNWNDLTQNMAHHLQMKYPLQFELLLNTTVQKVNYQKGKFTVYSLPNIKKVDNMDALFWTTPRPGWKPIQRFLPRSLLKEVQCQPFLRAYATPKHPEKAETLYPPHHVTHTRNDCCFQKVIPMSFSSSSSKKDDKIYMISYSDNQHAVESNQKFLTKNKQIQNDWKDPQLYFWECGTHYYSPSLLTTSEERDTWLNMAVHPSLIHPLFLANEGLSTQQGWTEGALESAERSIRQFLLFIN
jgi:hypothetical protein